MPPQKAIHAAKPKMKGYADEEFAVRHDCPKAAPSAAEAVLQYNRAGGRTKSDALVKIMLMLLEGVCVEGKGSDCRNARTQDGCGRCKNIPNLHWVHVGVSEDSLTRKAAGAAIEASGHGPANQDLNTTALVAEAAALGEIVSAVGPTFDLVGLIDEVVSDDMRSSSNCSICRPNAGMSTSPRSRDQYMDQ